MMMAKGGQKNNRGKWKLMEGTGTHIVTEETEESKNKGQGKGWNLHVDRKLGDSTNLSTGRRGRGFGGCRSNWLALVGRKRS